MVRSLFGAIACGLIVACVAGCQPSAESYRTYSEAEDGAAAPSVVQPPAEPDSVIAKSPLSPGSAVVPESTVPQVAASEAAAAVVGEAPMTGALDVTDAVAAVSVALPRPPRAPLPQRIAELPIETSDAAPTSPQVSLTSLTPALSDGPRPIELLVPEKDFSRVEPGNVLRVSYDDIDLLKVLNMEPVPPNCADHFPQWLKDLDGQRIRIRGFMYPPLRETGLTGFVLARDNQICCFGRFPKVYDVFPVNLAEGETTDYIPNRPFDVVGRFRIKPDVYRGEIENLYEIEDAQVIAR